MNNNPYKPPSNFPEGVSHLIIINVLMFLVSNLPFMESYDIYLIGHSFWSDYFRPWQIITHMFMHASIPHLLFNMFGLWMFGRILCSIWGTKRFLYFYFFCGIAAYFSHEMYLFYLYGTNPPSNGMGDGFLGASGAVYGILVGYATLFPNSTLMLIFPPIPIKAKYLVGIIILIDLYLGVSNANDGIAHFAHLGGGLAGFLLVTYWQKNKDSFY